MRFESIRDAKSRLYELVEEAEAGGEVVLVRGCTPVAAIVKLDPSDFELVGRFEDHRAAEALRCFASTGSSADLQFASAEDASRFVHESSRRHRRR